MSGELVAIVSVAAMAGYLVSAGRIRGRAIRGGRRRIAQVGGLAGWLPLLIFIPYLVIALRPRPELPLPDAVRWIGLALIVAGPAFSLWSAWTLGRHFDLEVELHEGHEIVDRGPYAIVRHPVYLGIAIHFIGACLATGNGALILGTVLGTFPALYLRASAEERLLRSRLGAAYDAYARRVPMLVPGPIRSR